ncbi:MAG: polyhydroxyalkanoate synthesis repressor PhaR [Arenicella sp.]
MTDQEQTIRIIKKYPNRRVYDTETSQYIKVDDLRNMVMDGIEFQVIDTQSKEDVTRSVLLQIILEQESEKNPLLTTDNLKHFIRYSNHQYSQLFSDYLTQNLNMFNQQQEQFQNNFQDMFTKNPMNMFSDLNNKNIETWQNMQKSFFEQFTNKKSD